MAMMALAKPCGLASGPLAARSVFRARAAAPGRLIVRAEAQQTQNMRNEAGNVALLAAAGLLLPLALDAAAPEVAQAVPELLKGRTFSLIHPAVMAVLFGTSLYAGWLGFQWRRARELVGEIKGLKAQLPAAGPDGARPPSPLDSQIASLEAERKSLIGKKLNEKHADAGSLLLGLGVLISVAGGYNTFLRTGKLFPGPHLYAGVAITVLWAAAAALVPAMQRGSEPARQAHIALNVLNILLFAWQIPTGFEIVGKVVEFTQWP